MKEVLVVQVDWEDVEDYDVISLLACKRIVLDKFAKANPKRIVELFKRESVSLDSGSVRNVIYYAARYSEPLIEKLAKQFKNAGFDARLCYDYLDDSWVEDAFMVNGEVK